MISLSLFVKKPHHLILLVAQKHSGVGNEIIDISACIFKGHEVLIDNLILLLKLVTKVHRRKVSVTL